MDKFKEKTIKEYTSWDLNCPHICPKTKLTNKLKLNSGGTFLIDNKSIKINELIKAVKYLDNKIKEIEDEN
jgi:hypothetical protein